MSVLLTGESGTGKSQLARAIHDNSRARERPVRRAQLRRAAREPDRERAVRRAARRALDGDARDRRARSRPPSGGTLFLDEIGELPLAAQAKLLQLLQSSEYYPLGGTAAGDAPTCASSPPPTPTCARRVDGAPLPRGPVLPPAGPADPHAGAGRAPRGHARPGRVTFCARACRRHGLPPLRSRPAPGCARSRRRVARQRAPARARRRGRRHPRRRRGRRGDRAAAPVPERAAHGRRRRTSSASTTPRAGSSASCSSARLRENEWNVAEVARRLELARSHVYNLIRAFELGRDRRREPTVEDRVGRAPSRPRRKAIVDEKPSMTTSDAGRPQPKLLARSRRETRPRHHASSARGRLDRQRQKRRRQDGGRRRQPALGARHREPALAHGRSGSGGERIELGEEHETRSNRAGAGVPGRRPGPGMPGRRPGPGMPGGGRESSVA